jgi:large subunit ribosomal protein L29
MTGAEARAMDPDKLAAELADLRRRLFSLQSQTVTEKVEDNTQFGKIKRDIARILTIQRERLNQAEPGRKRRARPGAAPAKTVKKAPAERSAKPAAAKSTKSKTIKPRGRAKARAAAR